MFVIEMLFEFKMMTCSGLPLFRFRFAACETTQKAA